METIMSFAEIAARNAAMISLVTAMIGLVAKHFSDRRLRTYEANVSFVRAQLKDLYGPLYLLSKSNSELWRSFNDKFRGGIPVWDANHPLSEEEKREYVRWLEIAFKPSNEKMRAVIEANAHLFREGSAPPSAHTLLAHFDALNVMLAKLKDGSGDAVFPVLLYPTEFGPYIERDYKLVVAEHARLSALRTAPSDQLATPASP